LVDDIRVRCVEYLDMSDTESPKAPTTSDVGSSTGSEVARSGPKSNRARPAVRRLAGWTGLVLGVVVAAALLLTRPDLPPRTNFETVSGLAASHAIMNMEVRGDTLTVTKRNGQRLRLEGITTDQYRRLQPAEPRRLVVVSPSNALGSLATELAPIATSVLPGVLGAATVLVVQAIMRRCQMRPARGC
jgi:hypothetical protein